MMGSIPVLKLYNGLTWMLIVMYAATTNAHVCITNPMQRLPITDAYYVSCYQQDSPCGRDFPSSPTLTQSSTIFESGGVHNVDMYLPITHYIPGEEVPIELYLLDNMGNNLDMKLGEFMAADEEFQSVSITLPQVTGEYLLQAVYKPPGYTGFYSCSDITLVSRGSFFNSNVVAPTPSTTSATTPSTTAAPIYINNNSVVDAGTGGNIMTASTTTDISVENNKVNNNNNNLNNANVINENKVIIDNNNLVAKSGNGTDGMDIGDRTSEPKLSSELGNPKDPTSGTNMDSNTASIDQSKGNNGDNSAATMTWSLSCVWSFLISLCFYQLS